MAKRGGPACGLLVKHVGRADLFNPLSRISPRGQAAGQGELTR